MDTIGLLPYLAGILLVAAFLMTSIRALRVFALTAGLAAFASFLSGGDELALLIAGLFVVVNAAQLLVLMRRAQAGTAMGDEQLLFDGVLGIGDSNHRGRLRDLITWRTARVGEVLMEQGQPDPPLVYIASGVAGVEIGERRVGLCGAGDFLGEMSLVSGDKASATVRVIEPMRIAVFDRDALGHFSREVPELGIAFSGALNRGLASKIDRMNTKNGDGPQSVQTAT